MKENKARCLEIILQWFVGAPVGQGVSMYNLEGYYGGGKTENDLWNINKDQVEYIFNACWGQMGADNLRKGIDLYVTVLAMHQDAATAAHLLRKALGSMRDLERLEDAVNKHPDPLELLDSLEGERKARPRKRSVLPEIRKEAEEMIKFDLRLENEVEMTKEDFLELYNRFLTLADLKDRQQPITMQENAELLALSCAVEKAPWEVASVDGKLTARLKSPQKEQSKEDGYKVYLQGLVDDGRRCCGNCAWRQEELYDRYGSPQFDTEEHEVICSYSPELVTRPALSVCHLHAFTTGWNENYAELRAADDVTRLEVLQSKLGAVGKDNVDLSEKLAHAKEVQKEMEDLLKLAGDRFESIIKGSQSITATFCVEWLSRYIELQNK